MTDFQPDRPGDERPPPRADATDRAVVAIGGDAACPHPADSVQAVGLGGPLRFGRCGRCSAVFVTDLVGRA